MLRSGENLVDGVAVEVRRKRIRRINLRIGEDGRVHLSVPVWWATLAEGEAFLRSKWKWILKVRSEFAAAGRRERPPAGAGEIAALGELAGELTEFWAGRFGEAGVEWRLRAMKTLWGSCNFIRRRITYSKSLAGLPRELVEYVVVHELTHLQEHDHGPGFKALMDDRLPRWRELRRKLNESRYAPFGGDGPRRYRQAHFAFM
jgi:predicted metal-dependent hydrolase